MKSGMSETFRNRVRDGLAGPGTALALPFRPLTLDGMVCIHPECTSCRRIMAPEVKASESWGEAVTA